MLLLEREEATRLSNERVISHATVAQRVLLKELIGSESQEDLEMRSRVSTPRSESVEKLDNFTRLDLGPTERI